MIDSLTLKKWPKWMRKRSSVCNFHQHLSLISTKTMKAYVKQQLIVLTFLFAFVPRGMKSENQERVPYGFCWKAKKTIFYSINNAIERFHIGKVFFGSVVRVKLCELEILTSFRYGTDNFEHQSIVSILFLENELWLFIRREPTTSTTTTTLTEQVCHR